MQTTQETDFELHLLTSLPAGIFLQDKQGQVVFLNKTAERILQVSGEELIDNKLRESAMFRESIALQEIESLCQRVWNGEESARVPIMLRNSDGELKGFRFHAVKSIWKEIVPVILILIHENPSGNGIGLEGVHTTARLAASLAHEIRNPLSSIKSAAQYLRRTRPDDEALLEFLDIILEEADAMNRVTTDFLEFSQENAPTESYVNRIDVVILRILRLLSPSFNEKNIRVVQNLDPNISEVLMESTQLEQVLRNIILNALEAMPKGGTLTVSTQQQSKDQPEVGIRIHDTGRGVPKDQIKRIFDRSFTTKRGGAGLGLSIVREIIDNHGGRVQVDSEQGSGTTFTLYLPATQTFTHTEK